MPARPRRTGYLAGLFFESLIARSDFARIVCWASAFSMISAWAKTSWRALAGFWRVTEASRQASAYLIRKPMLRPHCKAGTMRQVPDIATADGCHFSQWPLAFQSLRFFRLVATSRRPYGFPAALEELIKRIAPPALNIRDGRGNARKRVTRHVRELTRHGLRELHGALRRWCSIEHFCRFGDLLKVGQVLRTEYLETLADLAEPAPPMRKRDAVP